MLPIYFYLPKRDRPEKLHANPDDYWDGFGGGLTSGVYAWTLQTFLQLHRSGVPCELVSNMPEAGIIFSHRRSIPTLLRPSRRQFLVCLKADYERHPYAQVHVVLTNSESRRYRNCFHVPHWPQPGLIPRDTSRGDKFENICYFGETANLAEQLRGGELIEKIQSSGLKWTPMGRSRWNDFSQTDAIVAVRSFEDKGYAWKPATKLYNAWHAGVPAILGKELAYQAERKSELDYMEASTPCDVIDHLRCLTENIILRNAITENGKLRARESEASVIVRRWINFIERTAIPNYHKWTSASTSEQKIFVLRRSLSNTLHRFKMRLRHIVKGE